MSLPTGYTRLEYIESTGTQYIDTGVVPDANTKVECDFFAKTLDCGVFGARIDYDDNAFTLFWSTTNAAAIEIGNTFFAIGSKAVTNKRCVVEMSATSFKLDGETIQTYSQTAISPGVAIYIFWSSGASFSKLSGRVYSFKIYGGTTIVRNFIPCKNGNGTIGLWDDVSDTFYQNAGTGSFTAGPVHVGRHLARINGTDYEVKTGLCCVDGTGYTLQKGRTLVNGTGYDIKLAPPANIYGVEWDFSSSGSSKGVRTDDAVGFSDPSPAVNNGTGSSPFDELMPWAGMIRETRGGSVAVKEPKYWFKWTRTGTKLKLQIADNYVEGFCVDPVNMDREDGLGELDFSYICRYKFDAFKSLNESGTGYVYSTRSELRAEIHQKGSYFWQADYAQFWYINMLYLVEFADWDGQKTIGYGKGSTSSGLNNTDDMQYHTGTTAASRSEYGSIQYRNIDGLWSGLPEYIDGCYYKNRRNLYVIINPNNFSDTANGVLVGVPDSSYPFGTTLTFPSDFTIPTISGFEWALFPSTGKTARTWPYIPDAWGLGMYGGGPCLKGRNGFEDNTSYMAGPFLVTSGSTTEDYYPVASRWQERPPKTT